MPIKVGGVYRFTLANESSIILLVEDIQELQFVTGKECIVSINKNSKSGYFPTKSIVTINLDNTLCFKRLPDYEIIKED